MSVFNSIREVKVPMDESRWTLSLQREADGSVTLGMVFGDKPYLTHSATMAADDFKAILTELRFT